MAVAVVIAVLYFNAKTLLLLEMCQTAPFSYINLLSYINFAIQEWFHTNTSVELNTDVPGKMTDTIYWPWNVS